MSMVMFMRYVKRRIRIWWDVMLRRGVVHVSRNMSGVEVLRRVHDAQRSGCECYNCVSAAMLSYDTYGPNDRVSYNDEKFNCCKTRSPRVGLWLLHSPPPLTHTNYAPGGSSPTLIRTVAEADLNLEGTASVSGADEHFDGP